MSGSAEVIKANALDLPLSDNSVDLIVTSPPYFGLRNYGGGTDEVGAESTVDNYLDALIAATFEMVRVLKPAGSAFVNLGDSYRNKSLRLVPQRYAVRCSAELDLIVRSEVIWSKPNSFVDARATGRNRRTHETWWHLALAGDHYGNNELREHPDKPYADRPQYKRAEQLFAEAGLTDEHRAAVRSVGIVDSGGGQVRSGGSWDSQAGRLAREVRDALGSYYRELCGSGTASKGRMPGSVREVAAHPFKVPQHLGLSGHYASFPIEWPTQIIRGWSAPGMTVLDPFGGTGTTALAAKNLGRRGITVDISTEYCRIAEWRIQTEKETDR